MDTLPCGGDDVDKFGITLPTPEFSADTMMGTIEPLTGFQAIAIAPGGNGQILTGLTLMPPVLPAPNPNYYGMMGMGAHVNWAAGNLIGNGGNITIGWNALSNGIITNEWNGPLGPIVALGQVPKYPTGLSEQEYFGYIHASNHMLNVDFFEEKPHVWSSEQEPIKFSKYVYSATVMHITEGERKLSKERFQNYVNDIDDGYSANIALNTSDITEMVEWISENTMQKWTILKIKTNHIHFEFVFSFENKIDGGHFALRWI